MLRQWVKVVLMAILMLIQTACPKFLMQQNNDVVLLTQFGNYRSNSMISLVQKIDIANLEEIHHLDPSGGSRHA